MGGGYLVMTLGDELEVLYRNDDDLFVERCHDQARGWWVSQETGHPRHATLDPGSA